MSLVKNDLKEGLLEVIYTPTDSVDKAATVWSEAYIEYAKNGVAFGLNPLLVDATADFKDAVKDAFNGVSDSPLQSSVVANKLSVALTTFWLTPPIVFSVTPPIVVSAVSGSSALISGLISSFVLSPGATADSKADQIATAIDTFSKTVQVTNSIIPTTVNLS